MSNNNVKLGDGVADTWKQSANKELSDIGKILIDIISKFAKEKIQNIDLNELFSKKNEDELLNMWSGQLVEKGLISKGYAGLPEELLVKNLHQDGYLDGMFVGYALALMSMADNNAEKELILSVRDDIRPNLIGHHYDDRAEFTDRFKSEKYNWINSLSKEELADK